MWQLCWATGEILHVGGAPYFAINAVYTTTLVLPFIVDRLVASRTGGLASTLVFPMAFVAARVSAFPLHAGGDVESLA